MTASKLDKKTRGCAEKKNDDEKIAKAKNAGENGLLMWLMCVLVMMIMCWLEKIRKGTMFVSILETSLIKKRVEGMSKKKIRGGKKLKKKKMMG